MPIGTAKLAILDPLLWTPAQLPSMGYTVLGWYDPSDTTYITLKSNKITALLDKSGNGRNLTATATGGAATATLIGGSRTVITCNGSANTCFLFQSSTVLSGNDFSVAQILAYNTANPNYQRTLSLGSSAEYGNDYNINGYLDMSNNNNSTLLAETNGNYCGGTAVTNTGTIVDAVYSNTLGNTITASQNGTQTGSTGINYNFYFYTKYLYVFGSAGNGNHIGQGGEVIIGSAAWSADARARIQGYLAWRWGLVGSLPSSHTYKKAPPYA